MRAGEYKARKQAAAAPLVLEELEACAALVEAAGCACKTLCIDHDWSGEFEGHLYYTRPGGQLQDGRAISRHDSRCPVALAAKIRERRP
jgi:hypothetical protein